MRVVIRVSRELEARLEDAAGNALAPPRQLVRTPGEAFPLPPPQEPGSDLPAEDALDKALRAIVTRDLRQGPAAHGFARYLFRTLVGDAWWAAIRAHAGAAQAVDLALCWPGDLHVMSRLPWELMRSGEGFLAEQKAPHVAMTRVVAGAMDVPQTVDHPLRMLFVIGSAATDQAIRPGAEYFGLLRQLHARGYAAQTRVRDKVTPEVLEREVATFRPDVVHFICHGVPAPKGHGTFLELYDPQTGGRARYSAAKVAAALRPTGVVPPPIVLLNACYSGAPLTVDRSAPLAAELVASGIPIVIGMAGRISDLACRVFSRRFAAALVDGVPLVEAAAAARREVLIGVDPARQDLDWALPGVFVSEAVPAGYASASVVTDQTAVLIDRWLRRDDVRRMPRRSPAEDRLPMYCGRDAVFDAYYELLSPRGNSVLALYAEEPEKLGKTRTLAQLTAQAVRDGHVPVPLLVEAENPDWRGPETLDELADRLARAIRYTRELYELADAPSQLELVLSLDPAALAKHPELDPHIRRELELNRRADALRRALAGDLQRLETDARGQHAFIREAGGMAVVLLDEVHRYGASVTVDLTRTLLKASGLGAAGSRVPVVLAFSRPYASPALANLIDPRQKPSWLTPVPLARFSEQDNLDMQVYEHVLLHPFLPEDEYLRVPWTLNYELDKDKVRTMIESFRKYLRGSPSHFFDTLSILVHFARLQDFVRLANDEDLLAALRQEP